MPVLKQNDTISLRGDLVAHLSQQTSSEVSDLIMTKGRKGQDYKGCVYHIIVNIVAPFKMAA